MVFKKPYGFLIKHFKLIHLILTALYIYLTVKVNSLLQYYNDFIAGVASKLDARSYMTSSYSIAIICTVIICIIIYALMRYKKKPRALYLILIGFSIIIAFMIEYVYQGLDLIYISVLESKALLLYRDLLRILILFQYGVVLIVLIRGLGFDIKKFNFASDLHELNLDVTDEEEVELTINGTENIDRKINRNLRELKYYFLENKVFILIIVSVIVFALGFSWFLNYEVINKEYQENEVFSTADFSFQILDSYITNKSYDNIEIKDDGTSFVVVKINIGSNSEKRKLNTSNLILKIDNKNYACEKKYKSIFMDLGVVYRDDLIGSMTTYLFVYNVENEYLNKKMKIVYAEDKTVYLNPVMLDNISKVKEYKINDNIDLGNSTLGNGFFQISSFEINNKFSYPFQYQIDGKTYTNQLTISSVQNVIMHLKINSSYSYGLDNYSFLEKYAKLKYKKDDKEYIAKVFDNKTPGNYKEGLYLGVDKEIMDATNIWIDITIRNLSYRYILK